MLAGDLSPSCPTVSDGVRSGGAPSARPAKRAASARSARARRSVARAAAFSTSSRASVSRWRPATTEGVFPPEAKNAGGPAVGAPRRRGRDAAGRGADTASRALDGSPTASAKSFGTDSTWARPSRCASRHLFASDASATRDSRLRWSSSSGMTTDGERDGFDVRAGLALGSACVRAGGGDGAARGAAERPAEGARGVDAESPSAGEHDGRGDAREDRTPPRAL